MTNLAISFGAAPYGGGALAPQTATPAPANQVTLWPPSGRQPPRLTLVPGGGLSNDEYRLMLRALASVSARRAMRLHPWVRALDYALMGIEQYRAHGGAWPEFGQVPQELRFWEMPQMYLDMLGMLGPMRMTARDTRWTRIGFCPAGGSGFFFGSSVTTCDAFTTLYTNTRWNNYESVGGRLSFRVTSRTDIGGGYRGLPSATWRSDIGVTAAWPPKLTASNEPAIVRTIYPSAVNVLPQVQPLPHRLVGQVNRWREWISPRPDGKPLRENPLAAPNPAVPVASAPLIRPSVVVRPGSRPKPGPGHQNKPPGKGTKERKAKAAFAVAKAAMDVVTESVDAIEAVWYALPRHLRTPGAKPQQMLRDLYDHASEIDMNVAVRNLVLTKVQDAAIGKLSGPLQREFRKYRPDREFAFYGPV